MNYVIALCTFYLEIKSQLDLGITTPKFFWTVLNLSLTFSC